MKRGAYTCLFGHSELFNDFEFESDGIYFVCFTDDPQLRSDFWRIELLPRPISPPGAGRQEAEGPASRLSRRIRLEHVRR